MKSKNILIFLVLIASSVFLLLFIPFYPVYIDNKILSGEGYGFTVGDSKEKTYQKARSTFKGKKIYILYPLDKNEFGPHKEFLFSQKEYSLIAGQKNWEFYFDTGFYDSIRLTFDNDNLKVIYRYRKKFELP